ncbi:MAG: M23 family metallopeptidase [Christensenella sp.]|uniref:M23 family metallopeptidase n=1 Tax=Christensenella sp. TaxID=1935934 RepID=UPI002B210EAC|nr:M23 family metallopeptidase [Christensenella sp.]MEA5002172.1 M23 family metallopeptidase [Christensenella sp.]
MKKNIFILLLVLAFFFSACSIPQAPAVTPDAPASASPQANAAPTPTAPVVLPTFDEIIAGHTFSKDCTPQALYPTVTDLKGYDIIVENKEITQSFSDCFSVWFSEAVSTIQKKYEEFYPHVTITADIDAPTWQLLSSVAYGCESPEEFVALFPSLVSVVIEKNKDFTEENASFDVDVSAKTPQQLFYELPCTDGGDPSSVPYGLFTCTYLNTAYDENMEMIGPEEENLPVLAEQLTFPFAERYDFSNGWYADRDGGARRHTGTDILCPEGTEELACVDGTVLAVGTGEGTGNYVVIVGGDGTQYHYYHMVEVSDFVAAGDTVRRGDVVGLAGNTGNSTANHLHLAIIHPSGVYVNPYSYLKDAAMPDAQ